MSKEIIYRDKAKNEEWNPYEDYGNEYAYVDIGIYCSAVRKGRFDTMEERKEYDREIESVFIRLGWTIEKYPCGAWDSMEVRKEKEEFEVRCGSILGLVLKNDLRKLSEELNTCNSFKLWHVVIMATVLDITDQEYKKMLRRKKGEARELILTAAKTTRRKYFVNKKEVEETVALEIREERVGEPYGTFRFIDAITLRFVNNLIRSMVSEGMIISNGKMIRSANKTELKKLKL